MKGKVVVLPGGSGGLASAVAEMVAGRGGIPVIGCLNNRDRANDLVRGLRQRYGIEPPVVGDASIVFVSTMQAVGVFPGSTTYAAPKAALIHTSRILAKQWKIRVNTVAPGVNNAGMAAQSVTSGKYDSYLTKTIIPRFGRPEDIARAILFFLEPDNYVTGQVLTVDGGLTLKM